MIHKYFLKNNSSLIKDANEMATVITNLQYLQIMISLEELKKVVKTDKFPESKPIKFYLSQIEPWLERKEIIIIKGIRHSGKTHLMYQLIKNISENTFYIIFEDFRLDKYLNVELLEILIQLRNKNERSYFFLDEIQRVEGFEKWLRTYYDKEENIKFIIGGSNISLLAPSLSTVLTGRNITFSIYPLSFHEIESFANETFENYLEFGGFPEVVLEPDKLKKRRLLEQYVDDIIMKDIINRYELNNIAQLKALISFFLSNPGVRISANKLSKQLGIHKDTAQKYISYIIDTFLIFEVPYFSYSAKTKYVGTHASKYYCVDNGIHTITSLKKNTSLLFENLIAIKLKEDFKDLYYWLDDVEIDFVAKDKAIQVTATDNIPEREIEAFDRFNSKFKKFKNILITPCTTEKKGKIKIIDIQSFLKK